MKSIILVGPQIVAMRIPDVVGVPRQFLVIARDESCSVELTVDEPWRTKEEIGDRLAGPEGLYELVASVARYLRRGGRLGST